MSMMANTTKLRRPRRRFPEEFRAGAVRLVLDEGKTAGQVVLAPLGVGAVMLRPYGAVSYSPNSACDLCCVPNVA